MIIIEKDNTNLFYIKYINDISEKFGVRLNKKFKSLYGILRDKVLVVNTNLELKHLSRYKNIYILLYLENNELIDDLKKLFDISDIELGFSKCLLLLISNGKLIEKSFITDEKIKIVFNFQNVEKLDNYGLSEFQNRYNYILKLLYNDNIEILENRGINMEMNLDMFKYDIEYKNDNLGDIPELFKKLVN